MGRAIPSEWTVNLFALGKRTLEIQGSRTPTEYIPSTMASRLAEADHCQNNWKDARQKK
jgi:hypothetical protein